MNQHLENLINTLFDDRHLWQLRNSRNELGYFLTDYFALLKACEALEQAIKERRERKWWARIRRWFRKWGG